MSDRGEEGRLRLAPGYYYFYFYCHLCHYDRLGALLGVIWLFIVFF